MALNALRDDMLLICRLVVTTYLLSLYTLNINQILSLCIHSFFLFNTHTPTMSGRGKGGRGLGRGGLTKLKKTKTKKYDADERDENNWLSHAGYSYIDFIAFIKTYLREDFLTDNPLTIVDLDLSCAPPGSYPDHDNPECIRVQCPKDVRDYILPLPFSPGLIDNEEYCFVSANMPGGGHDTPLEIIFIQDKTETELNLEVYARTLAPTKKSRLI